MSEFYEFRNCCGTHRQTDDNGDLIMPDHSPAMRDSNGNYVDMNMSTAPANGRNLQNSAAQPYNNSAGSPSVNNNTSSGRQQNTSAEQAIFEFAKQSGFSTPPQVFFNDDAFEGSLQQILADNLGQYVVCEFLIGTEAMAVREGILYTVGRSYITLYDDASGRFVVCDIFSIKFVTFFFPGDRPQRTNNANSRNASSSGMGMR